ncbi:MAG: hypothetical protein JXK07_07760 [Spirochaetes bacterium]|nr:hypothetical protein [Spirochaetota bacterium]MBN2770106.1 hypothetical protein [Spirochaetota bacterium]
MVFYKRIIDGIARDYCFRGRSVHSGSESSLILVGWVTACRHEINY